MTSREFSGLVERKLARMQARMERMNEEGAALKEVVAMMDGAPRTMSVRAAAEQKAAAGDPAAIALLEHFDSPASRLQEALLEAAVNAHPDWSSQADGSYLHHPPEGALRGDPFEQPKGLVDWYLDTYPSEAAAIAEAVTGVRATEVPS